MRLFELDQEPVKKVVFAFGRLNPPHYGHGGLIQTLAKTAKEKGAHWYLFVSSKNEPEKNPLTFEQKCYWIKALFPEVAGHLIEDPSIKTPLVAATWLYKQGFRSATFVAGEDDMESYAAMIKSGNAHGIKNPDAVKAGKGFIFEPLEFAVSARLASATNARAAVENNDPEAFARSILGPRIGNPELLAAVETQLFQSVRKGMNLGESIEEARRKPPRKSAWKKMAGPFAGTSKDLDKSDERAQDALAGLKNDAADYKKLVDKDKQPTESVELDKHTPSVAALAKKYATDKAKIHRQLGKGIKVEFEHTDDIDVATEIAMDHLNERLDYYEQLAKAEIAPKKKIGENFADGKGPGKPGDSQRHGIPKKATIAQLEKASHAKGRKGQLARWQLNMRRGRKTNEGGPFAFGNNPDGGGMIDRQVAIMPWDVETPKKSSEMIDEVANMPYKFKELDHNTFVFKTDDNNAIQVTIDSQPNYTDISFFDQTKGNLSIAATGKGDAFRIFATIGAIVKKFTDKYKPKTIEFNGKTQEASRIKLYDMISRNIGKYIPAYKFAGESMPYGDSYKIYKFERIKDYIIDPTDSTGQDDVPDRDTLKRRVAKSAAINEFIDVTKTPENFKTSEYGNDSEYDFTVGNTKIEVTINGYIEDYYIVAFENRTHRLSDPHAATGSERDTVFGIFNGVAYCLHDFITKHPRAEVIIMGAKSNELSRIKLYDRAAKFFEQMGFKAITDPVQQQKIFRGNTEGNKLYIYKRRVAAESLDEDLNTYNYGGWISPKGKINYIEDEHGHEEWINNNANMEYEEALKNNWIRFATQGASNLYLNGNFAALRKMYPKYAGNIARVPTIIVDVTDRPGTHLKFDVFNNPKDKLRFMKMFSPEYAVESLEETLKKVKGKWALVSRKDPKKVLQYYKGSGHPSKDWVSKVERRVHSFSESTINEIDTINIEKDSSSQSDIEIKVSAIISKYGKGKFVQDIYGCKLFKTPANSGNVAFYLLDPKNRGIGYFSFSLEGKAWHPNLSELSKAYQGKGIGLYCYIAIIESGMMIRSGHMQSIGAQKLWNELSDTPGILVYAVKPIKGNRFEYSQVEPGAAGRVLGDFSLYVGDERNKERNEKELADIKKEMLAIVNASKGKITLGFDWSDEPVSIDSDADKNLVAKLKPILARRKKIVDLPFDNPEDNFLVAIATKTVKESMDRRKVAEGREEALQFATQAHTDQTRSGGEPYIRHPERVAELVRKYKDSKKLDELLSAAFLHDTIEDTDTTEEQLRKMFGDLVATLVKELTSDKEKIEKLGKAEYLTQKMINMSSWALVIKLADRLDNVADIKTAKTPEWRHRYREETESILRNLEQNRKLSGTHQNIIAAIRGKLAEIDESYVAEAEEDSPKPRVYLDMDGVLADFFGEWARISGVNHYKDIDNVEAKLQLVREHPTFWVDLPVLPHAKELIRTVIKNYGEYRICSKALEGDARSKPGKMQWISTHLSDMPPVEVILTADKAKFATNDGVPCILVDDYGVNINSWRAAGGIGIKYDDPSFPEVAKILTSIAKSGVPK